MNFLSRWARPSEISLPDDSQRVVHREIEITYQREWTSADLQVAGDPRAPQVCLACGQALPCTTAVHVADEAPKLFALEDTHDDPNL